MLKGTTDAKICRVIQPLFTTLVSREKFIGFLGNSLVVAIESKYDTQTIKNI